MPLPTRIHPAMVYCARFFHSLVISHQEAHKWRLTPTRASVTTTFFRRSVRAGWVKSGERATCVSTAKSLSNSYLARQRQRPTDSARGKEEKICFLSSWAPL